MQLLFANLMSFGDRRRNNKKKVKQFVLAENRTRDSCVGTENIDHYATKLLLMTALL